MPRGIYNRKTSRSANQKADSTSLIPTNFSGIKGWDKLNLNEQKEVVEEGNKAGIALAKEGAGRIEAGEHLSNLQDILEPHGLFQKFVRANFKFSVRTAYRYISGFKNAKSMLPEIVLKTAMARGYNIVGDSETKPLGVYTDAVAALPVPQNPTQLQANTWLDQVEAVRRDARSRVSRGANITPMSVVQIPRDPNTMLKECYRFFVTRFKMLPSNHKVRANWVRSLVGMELTELGVGGAQSFTPVAPPEDFRIRAGRPRGVTAVAA